MATAPLELVCNAAMWMNNPVNDLLIYAFILYFHTCVFCAKDTGSGMVMNCWAGVPPPKKKY